MASELLLNWGNVLGAAWLGVSIQASVSAALGGCLTPEIPWPRAFKIYLLAACLTSIAAFASCMICGVSWMAIAIGTLAGGIAGGLAGFFALRENGRSLQRSHIARRAETLQYVDQRVEHLKSCLTSSAADTMATLKQIQEQVNVLAAQADEREEQLEEGARADESIPGKGPGLLAAGIGEDDGVGFTPNGEDRNIPAEGVSVTVWYATNRKAIRHGQSVIGYGKEWDENVHYGKCTVTVDADRPTGGFHDSVLAKILLRKGSGVAVSTLEQLDETICLAQLKAQLAEVPRLGRSLLIFIHGYWNSFETAIQTAGALAADVNGWAGTAVFSWPSEGIGAGYFRDAEMCAASEWQCESAIRKMIEDADAESVHFVGHSMGNRLLLRVLERLKNNPPKNLQIIKNIVFAAPDVERTIFEALVSRGPGEAVRKTLYMSKRDRALSVSRRWANRTDRAGLAPPVLICNGVDTIDVTDVDLSSNGHRAFREAPKVIEDMYYLITKSHGPDARHGLVVEQAGERAYWRFKE